VSARRSRRRLLAAGMMLAGLPAAAAGPGTDGAARGPLTLAVADSLYTLPLLIAEKMGYFALEDLQLRLIRLPVGRLNLQRLLAGEVQFATVADAPIMFASMKRTDFSILATLSRSFGDSRMMVRADRGIEAPGNLRGRRIGVPRGSGGHFYVDTFLLYYGLTTADVTLVPIESTKLVDALVNGEIDGAGIFGALANDAQRRLGSNARVLPGPAFFAVNFNLVSVPASAGVTDADALKLLRAVERANELIRRNPAQARQLAVGILKVDPKEVERAWDAFEYRLQLAQPLVAQLEAQFRWAQREKLLPPGSKAPEFLDLIRAEPLRQLDPRAVRLVR